MAYLPSARISRLRVRHLTLLDIIADSGSLRKASTTLCVTQPAVTLMLQDMESLLEVRLVDRDQQGASLTPAGSIVRERLRLVLNALRSVELSVATSPPRPCLRVGALALAMLELVPDVLAHMRRERPEIRFEFIEGTVEEMLNGVSCGEFDCAIGRLGAHFPTQLRNDLEMRVIKRIPLRAVCGINNPLGAALAVTLEELQERPWILLPRGTRSRESFDQAFAQNGLIPPYPTVESMSFQSNFHLAARTDLLTIATATAVAHYSSYGVIRPIDIQWPVQLPPLMFFARKDALELDAVRAFYQAIEWQSSLVSDVFVP